MHKCVGGHDWRDRRGTMMLNVQRICTQMPGSGATHDGGPMLVVSMVSQHRVGGWRPSMQAVYVVGCHELPIRMNVGRVGDDALIGGNYSVNEVRVLPSMSSSMVMYQMMVRNLVRGMVLH